MIVVAALAGLLALAGYIACFVFAAQTGRLRVSDYLIGSIGMLCGLGSFYFLYRANTVTLQHSFDLIERGSDPSVARALNQRFKMAAGAAIVGTIVATIMVR